MTCRSMCEMQRAAVDRFESLDFKRRFFAHYSVELWMRADVRCRRYLRRCKRIGLLYQYDLF